MKLLRIYVEPMVLLVMARLCCGSVLLSCWVVVVALQELKVRRQKGGELVMY